MELLICWESIGTKKRIQNGTGAGGSERIVKGKGEGNSNQSKRGGVFLQQKGSGPWPAHKGRRRFLELGGNLKENRPVAAVNRQNRKRKCGKTGQKRAASAPAKGERRCRNNLVGILKAVKDRLVERKNRAQGTDQRGVSRKSGKKVTPQKNCDRKLGESECEGRNHERH